MKVQDLIYAYAYHETANYTIAIDDEGLSGTIIFHWDAVENRHPDDGSYSNVLHYMPADIAKAEVSNFTFIPEKMVIDDSIYTTGTAECIYIMIPVYSELYRYLEDDNYPFL